MTNVEIYEAALREAGFDDRAVATGLRLLEAQNTFSVTVSLLQLQGRTVGVREHELGQIKRAVELAEARAEIIARGERASAAIAATRAEEEDRRQARDRLARETHDAMSWLVEHMNDDELQERVPFRPHIAEGWRRYLALRGEEQRLDEGQVSPAVEEQLQALDAGNRLRLTSSDAGGGTGAVSEAGGGHARGVNGL